MTGSGAVVPTGIFPIGSRAGAGFSSLAIDCLAENIATEGLALVLVPSVLCLVFSSSLPGSCCLSRSAFETDKKIPKRDVETHRSLQ